MRVYAYLVRVYGGVVCVKIVSLQVQKLEWNMVSEWDSDLNLELDNISGVTTITRSRKMIRSSDQSDTDNSDQDDIRDMLNESPSKDSGYR